MGYKAVKTKMDKVWALYFTNSLAQGRDRQLTRELKYDGVRASMGDTESAVGMQVRETLNPLVKEAQRGGSRCAEP